MRPEPKTEKGRKIDLTKRIFLKKFGICVQKDILLGGKIDPTSLGISFLGFRLNSGGVLLLKSCGKLVHIQEQRKIVGRQTGTRGRLGESIRREAVVPRKVMKIIDKLEIYAAANDTVCELTMGREGVQGVAEACGR